MRSYTVHHRQSMAHDQYSQAEGLVFVREGFCWPALAIPALWLIYRQLWLVLIAGFVGAGLVLVVVNQAGLDETGMIIAVAAIQILLAAQAYDLWRWTLARAGYDMIGLATGRTIVEAEQSFFQAWLAHLGPAETPSPATPVPPAQTGIPQTLPAPVVGLFDAQDPA
ncbi:MAG: DUF2628 domain-containing protein [Alphaproteobacteria bacterium]